MTLNLNLRIIRFKRCNIILQTINSKYKELQTINISKYKQSIGRSKYRQI